MNRLHVSIFFLVLLGLVLLAHLYIYRRAVMAVGASPKARAGAKVLLAGLATLLVLRLGATAFRQALPGPLPWIAAAWMGLSAYLFLALAAAHGLQWLGGKVRPPPASPERRLFLARAAAGTSLAAATGIGAFGVWRAFSPPEVTELAVRVPNLPRALDGMRIVQMSDIHLGDVLQGRFLRARVAQCNALKPDLVAVTGDLVDGSVERLGNAAGELTRLQSRYGTAFCMGNHEYYSGDLAWEEALTKMGLTVLRNRFVSVGDPGASFDLVGVDDWSQRRRPRGYSLRTALEGRDPSRAAVLLAHQPYSFPQTARAGLGLQLSGHTHGGQFFPFTEVAALALAFNVGRYSEGESTLYVNRGTGFWGPSMRVGSPPEITLIHLVA
jgi:predicted MPP superfamily phosphohydrolase